jgi:chromosomal replication initiator protein
MTQEEFFNTFNILHNDHKQIVLTSDKYPQDIPQLEDRLRSRFQWGLITDIQVPELETRMAIIRNKADRRNISLSDDLVVFLASSIQTNVRELEGCLTRLGAFSDVTGKDLTLAQAKDVLRNLLPERVPSSVTVEVVQRCVSNYYNIAIADLKSDKRHKKILLPRQIAMYLARKLTQGSYADIGVRFDKDHSTVINACQKIEKLIKEKTPLQTEILLLEAELHD